MKHLLALTLLLLALSACKKHTEYSGQVLSSADGRPVAGARVRLVFGISTGPGESELSASDEMTTDSSGAYLVSCEVKRYDTRNFLAEKEGFIKFQKLPETNNCEKLDIILDPLDAWLGLEVENSRDTTIMCYALITGVVYQGLGDRFPGGQGPYEIPAHSSRYIGTQKVPGGYDLEVLWNDERIKSLKEGSNRTPVFCPRNDTTVVKVVF
ncbi:MAG: carboxypeptidase regulatory-like domain-containing protein [Chitinophagales bacterium]|nr:carboxypeptidase regulatory-like domain-containing protein [Chitinophagales bacterium]